MARKGTTDTSRAQERQVAPESGGQILSANAGDRRDANSTGPTGNDGSSENSGLRPDEIAARAYQIFEREGRLDGKDMEHWLQAERELREERKMARRDVNRLERGTSASRPSRPDEAPRSARQHQPSMS
jgi:hypothetical protein